MAEFDDPNVQNPAHEALLFEAEQIGQVALLLLRVRRGAGQLASSVIHMILPGEAFEKGVNPGSDLHYRGRGLS